jgi:uncharacterized membrane protein
VISEDLPPLLEKYQNQLLIVGIDTYTEQGHELYEAVVNHYQITPERLGVPTMLVGETVLVGSFEIPERFPGIIEDGLAAGGISWPGIPEVQKLLLNEGILESDNSVEQESSDDVEANQPVFEDASKEDTNDRVQQGNMDENEKVDGVNHLGENATVDEQTDVVEAQEEAISPEGLRLEGETTGISTNLDEAVLAADQMTMAERFVRDKTGNTISVIVLLGMMFSMVGVVTSVLKSSITLKPWPHWMVPVLVLIGMFVAIYMGYVEVTQTEAVCGPVGDCNTVQQSSYASLFGVLPIGVLGLAGYFVIGITWVLSFFGPLEWRSIGVLSSWFLSWFGALFSIYLTFLEPFVIGASCAWCLTSAIIMNLLVWATTGSALNALKEYRVWLSVRFSKRFKT